MKQKKPREKTVRKTIFISNSLMVVIMLALFLVISICAAKIYAESIEHEVEGLFQHLAGSGGRMDLDKVISQWIIKRDGFFITFAVDGAITIGVMLLVSQLFTRRLTNRIMEPLEALSEGVERISSGDLTQDVEYQGEKEFEKICGAFNEMQRNILAEKEKNRRYEEARIEMIAGISHDLRTPLTAVRGTIRGLIDGIADTPEKQQKFLLTADRRAQEMNRLLQQLLDISRMETGHEVFNMQKVDISGVIKNYVRDRSLDLIEGQEFLEEDVSDEEVFVNVDQEKMWRIFENLVGNSRKYVEERPLRMKISMTVEGDDVDISFRDNGNGVPPEKLPYIFDVFYRVDESRHQKEGSGLGLYIVQYLVKEMNGTVRAENDGGLVIHMLFKKEEPEDGRESEDPDR
ncbi:MAG: sensor histidine kinase [Anaerovoracaceae bacterium]|jgi:signal transduction histidine kinase